RHLLQGHFAAVIIDPNVLEETGVRAAGTQLLQLVAQCAHALLHALCGVLFDVFQHGSYAPLVRILRFTRTDLTPSVNTVTLRVERARIATHAAASRRARLAREARNRHYRCVQRSFAMSLRRTSALRPF